MRRAVGAGQQRQRSPKRFGEARHGDGDFTGTARPFRTVEKSGVGNVVADVLREVPY
jgi:hypothetical protein